MRLYGKKFVKFFNRFLLFLAGSSDGEYEPSQSPKKYLNLLSDDGNASDRDEELDSGKSAPAEEATEEPTTDFNSAPKNTRNVLAVRNHWIVRQFSRAEVDEELARSRAKPSYKARVYEGADVHKKKMSASELEWYYARLRLESKDRDQRLQHKNRKRSLISREEILEEMSRPKLVPGYKSPVYQGHKAEFLKMNPNQYQFHLAKNRLAQRRTKGKHQTSVKLTKLQGAFALQLGLGAIAHKICLISVLQNKYNSNVRQANSIPVKEIEKEIERMRGTPGYQPPLYHGFKPYLIRKTPREYEWYVARMNIHLDLRIDLQRKQQISAKLTAKSPSVEQTPEEQATDLISTPQSDEGSNDAYHCIRCGNASDDSSICDKCETSVTAKILNDFVPGAGSFVTRAYLCCLLTKVFNRSCSDLPGNPTQLECMEEAEKITQEAEQGFIDFKANNPSRKFSHSVVGATTRGRARINAYVGRGHLDHPDFNFIEASTMAVALLAEVLSAITISNLPDVVSKRDRPDQTLDPSGRTNLINGFNKLGMHAKANLRVPSHTYVFLKESAI